MKKNLVKYDGHYFFLENGALYEDGTNRKVNDKKYLFVSNYGTRPFDILVIEKTVFFIFSEKVKEISTYSLLEGKYADYFYTATENEKGEGIYVFSKTENGRPMLIGRSFSEITDNVYKIGKKAYQIAREQLLEMCECTEFDRYVNRLEIHTGEKDYSEMYVYEKHGGIWEQTYKWIPGQLQPQYAKEKTITKTRKK